MQSKVFVFVGLTDRSQTVDMTALQETLNHLTIVPDNAFSLEESTKLLTAMIEELFKV